MSPSRLVYLNRRHNRQVAQLTEILAEMGRQDAKWGAHRDHPSLPPRPPGHAPCDYDMPAAATIKANVDHDAKRGRSNWLAIALEELCEAAESRTERERRGELLQLAAVCMQWIDNIDRRAGRKGRASERHEAPDAGPASARRGDGLRRRRHSAR